MASPQHGLGRIAVVDPQDRAYPMRSLLPRRALPATGYRYYRCGPVLDQGGTGTCVGHAWRQFLASAPLMYRPGDPTAFHIYREAIEDDEFPENDAELALPDNRLQYGTSVRAGVKALQKRGHIKNYAWAWNALEVAEFIMASQGGTVVVGTAWREEMFFPNKTGLVHIGGRYAGGHAYLIIGFNAATRLFRCLNSWGSDWGIGGRFSIRFDDMDELLKDNGEACVATEQKLVPVL